MNREIYLRDISERYGISNSSGEEELTRVIALDIGSLTNLNRQCSQIIDYG